MAHKPSRECYDGNGINCDICATSVAAGDTLVWHCDRERVPEHPGGFDMCDSCADNKRVSVWVCGCVGCVGVGMLHAKKCGCLVLLSCMYDRLKNKKSQKL